MHGEREGPATGKVDLLRIDEAFRNIQGTLASSSSTGVSKVISCPMRCGFCRRGRGPSIKGTGIGAARSGSTWPDFFPIRRLIICGGHELGSHHLHTLPRSFLLSKRLAWCTKWRSTPLCGLTLGSPGEQSSEISRWRIRRLSFLKGSNGCDHYGLVESFKYCSSPLISLSSTNYTPT